jgi:hypothetical protein
MNFSGFFQIVYLFFLGRTWNSGYFILEISVAWGSSVSRAVAVFALLLAERGGIA